MICVVVSVLRIREQNVNGRKGEEEEKKEVRRESEVFSLPSVMKP